MSKKQKLLFKMVFSYSALVVIVFGSVLGIVTYKYFNFIFLEKSNVYKQKADIVLEQLDENIQKVGSLHSQISKIYGMDDLEEGIIKDGSERLAELRAVNWEIRGIYLYDSSLNMIDHATDSLAGTPDFRGLEAFVKSRAYRKFEVQDNALIYFGAISLFEKEIFGYDAYVVFVLDAARMVYNMNNEAKNTFDGVYLLDGDTIVSEYGAEVNKELITGVTNNQRIISGNNSYMVFRKRDGVYAEWELVALVNVDVYLQEIMMLFVPLSILTVIAIILIILISIFISSKITNTISEINQAMVQLEQGNYPPALVSGTNDEINELIQGFNHMVQSLKKLNEDVIREQEEKRKYEVEKIHIQLELLQSQINPHFIHNTLNALKFMALSAGNNELASVITSFNSLLRASISTNTEFTTVEEECQYVMEYMNIQKIRYSSRKIECTAYIEPEVRKGLLPRLILQPLVENSLFHGILPMEDKEGIINIVCLAYNGFLHIYIVDNGVGIPEEMIYKINSGELKVTNGYNHIGLNNVRERLNLMYQADHKFIIASEPQSGTTIYFCVPYEE